MSKKIQIGVIETDHEKSRSIKQFCDTLSQMVPKIRIKQEEGKAGRLAEMMPWLETIINGDDDAEVKEAAREALDKLKQKE